MTECRLALQSHLRPDLRSTPKSIYLWEEFRFLLLSAGEPSQSLGTGLPNMAACSIDPSEGDRASSKEECHNFSDGVTCT